MVLVAAICVVSVAAIIGVVILFNIFHPVKADITKTGIDLNQVDNQTISLMFMTP